jgi:hypothetical protein
MMRGPIPLCAALLLGACTPPEAPPAQAPLAAPHPGVTVWEQFCEQSWNVPQASALAAARGAAGWELVAMYNGVLCYKRPTAPVRVPYAPPDLGPVPIVRDPGF